MSTLKKYIGILTSIFSLFTNIWHTTFFTFILLYRNVPSPQGFVTLPLQNKISITSFIKHLTLVNITTSLLVFIVFFLLRNYIFPNIFYIKVTFLDEIPAQAQEFHINKDFILGILAVITRFSLKGLVEDFIAPNLATKLPIGDANLPPFLYQDKMPAQAQGESSKPTPELIAETKRGQKVIDEIFTEAISVEFDKFRVEMAKVAKSLKDRHEMFDEGKVTMSDLDIPKLLVMMLQDQTQFYNASILKRIE